MGRWPYSFCKISSTELVYISLPVNSTPRVEVFSKNDRRSDADGLR
jgi:hypothetical protein